MSEPVLQVNFDEELRAEWDRFLSGHWQLEIPEKTGVYPTKHFVEDLQWQDVVVYYNIAEDQMECTTKDFGGYYWSEPRPKMPMPNRWL